MFVEHQSTSDTKIRRHHACTRALLLIFISLVFTDFIVYQRLFKDVKILSHFKGSFIGRLPGN